MRIKNKGTYLLSVLISIQASTQTGTTKQENRKNSFTVTSAITSVSLSIGSSADAYKDLSPTLTVKGDNDIDYLDGLSVLLIVSDGSSAFTSGSLTDIQTASTTVNFYLKTSGSGNLIINVTSDDQSFTQDYNLTVNPAKFIINKRRL